MFEELLEVYKKKVAESEGELQERQAMIGLIMAVENISGMLSTKQQNVDLLGRLIDQVDHLSKEVADLKSQMKTRHARSSPGRELKASDGYAMDKHTANLIDLLKERPGRYTTSELVEMLGLNKTTVISVMKRAVDMDPSHVKLTQGKRRKLFLAYIPDDQDQSAKTEAEAGAEDSERIRLELMSMT